MACAATFRIPRFVPQGLPAVNTVGTGCRKCKRGDSGPSAPYSRGMKRAERERISVRIALAVGFIGTLGLWLYTNYAFTLADRDRAARRRASGGTLYERAGAARDGSFASDVEFGSGARCAARPDSGRDPGLPRSARRLVARHQDGSCRLPTGAAERSRHRSGRASLERSGAVSSALAAGPRRRSRPHAGADSRRAEPRHRPPPRSRRLDFGGDPGHQPQCIHPAAGATSPPSIAAPKPRAATGSAWRSSSASARCC